VESGRELGARVAAALSVRLIKDSGDTHQVRGRSPTFRKGFGSEADFARIPDAHLINQDDVSSGMSPNYFISKRRSAKASLFRIYLEQ
jgi:hypothetical protein